MKLGVKMLIFTLLITLLVLPTVALASQQKVYIYTQNSTTGLPAMKVDEIRVYNSTGFNDPKYNTDGTGGIFWNLYNDAGTAYYVNITKTGYYPLCSC